jgi:hypothetical protein
MTLSFLLLLIASLGGLAVTYLIERDMRLMVRLLAGHAIGVTIWGTLAFVLGFGLGINSTSSAISLGLSVLPVLLFLRSEFRQRLARDWKTAQSSLQGRPLAKAAGLAYYLFFFFLFVAFFDRAMIVRDSGIFTGAASNFGDLPAHLGAIFAFTEGAAFPPDNPSFAGSTFTYPFLIDLVTALVSVLGASIQDAMLVQNVILCFAILVLLERFAGTISDSRFVGRLVPVLFLLGGGLGFVWFIGDHLESGRSFADTIWNLGKDYTIGDEYRWGNPMTTMLITQRSFLIGLPLALVALTKIWDTLSSTVSDDAESARRIRAMFLTGIVIGLLPLVHIHSLGSLFLICAVLLLFCKRDQLKEMLAFGIGVALIAIPELVWLTSDSASQVSEFVGLQKGWESSGENPLLFWARNTGILIPILLAGLVIVWRMRVSGSRLLNFYLPFLILFFVGNFVSLAPWGWDNIKVLIYWFVASVVFVAIAIEKIWHSTKLGKAAATVLITLLVASGGLDVWRVVSGQVEMEVFNRELVDIADEIRKKIPPDALFVHEPTHNSPLVLTGRRSLMRYTGHLFSYGIDYTEREEDVRHILSGGNLSQELIGKYGVEYILVSEQERSAPDFDEASLTGYRLVISKGWSRVYKIVK